MELDLQRELPGRIDASQFNPEKIAGLSLEQVASLRIPLRESACQESIRLSDWFSLAGEPSAQVVIRSSTGIPLHRLDCVGQGMESGSITVIGSIGSDAAASMRDGQLHVQGSVGNGCGASMKGGCVIVEGDAGNNLCGPSIGLRTGMRGGDCIVMGNVGDRAAERMRRGTLLIVGDAGDYGCVNMIAGTVICLSGIGHHWLSGMKRGSLILMDNEQNELTSHMDAQLTEEREFELSFLPLIWKHLRFYLGDRSSLIPSTRWAKRRIGDRSVSGMGEVLSLTRLSLR